MAIAALVWVVIPMLGLLVDIGILYSVKARLQAAVDGAALAAARALNLGQTTAEQATAAQQNAVNWFYANFPPGNWSTTGTVMTTANVIVVNSPSNANLRQVTVTATTNVPAWFMRYRRLHLHRPHGQRPSFPQGSGRHAGAGPFRIDVRRQRRGRESALLQKQCDIRLRGHDHRGQELYRVLRRRARSNRYAHL